MLKLSEFVMKIKRQNAKKKINTPIKKKLFCAVLNTAIHTRLNATLKEKNCSKEKNPHHHGIDILSCLHQYTDKNPCNLRTEVFYQHNNTINF